MNGVIVALPPLATEVGLDVLRAGGTAADAAVATAFAQAALDPWNCGIGGLGAACVYNAAAGAATSIQFYARVGSRFSAERWADAVATRLPTDRPTFADYRHDVGHSSVCTPGTVAGLWELHRRWGLLSWRELVAPAARLAADGWLVTPTHAEYWRTIVAPTEAPWETRIRASPACAALFVRPDGALLQARDRLRNPDMARLLERIAAEGPPALYAGATADAIADELGANGGFVTAADMAAYQATGSTPLKATYRGYTVLTEPPPGGGLALLLALRLLERHPLTQLRHNSVTYLGLILGAIREAITAHRQFVGDPASMDVPVEELLGEAFISQFQHRMQSQQAAVPIRAGAGGHTTQVCAVDKDGNIVTLTHTLGSGSGVVVPGLGFILNNGMAFFSYHEPGHPRAPAPGKARPSLIAPTIILRPDGSPLLAIGAPGGDWIPGALLQVVLNVIDFEMGAVEAVSAPRIDYDGGPVKAESRIPGATLNGLEAQGYEVHRSLRPYRTGNVGATVYALLCDQRGQWRGGADPRWYGSVLTDEQP